VTGSTIGRYDVEAEVGKGASGTVYRALRRDLGRRVAIKVLAQRLLRDQAFRDRFREEARILASLNHPNVVELYEFAEHDDEAYIVAEYVDGLSLRKVVKHARRLTPEQALGVLKGALSGLGHAHFSGLVHQDVKPDNILVDREGASKLVDFGQALRVTDASSGRTANLGTAAYMSPELCSGEPVDQRSDLYGAGVLLYELLTGSLPFSAAGAAQLMRKHVSAPVPDPRKLVPALPAPVAEMVMKALAKQPGERFQDADAFLLALESAAVAGYGEDWEKRASIKTVVASALAGAGLLAGIASAVSGALGSGAALPILAGGVAAAVAAGVAIGVLAHGQPPTSARPGPRIALRVDSQPRTPLPATDLQPALPDGDTSPQPPTRRLGTPGGNPGPRPMPVAAGTAATVPAGGSGPVAGTDTTPGTSGTTGPGANPPGGSPPPGGGGGTPPPSGGGLLPTVIDIPAASLGVDFQQCSAVASPRCATGSPMSGSGHASTTTAYPLFGGSVRCTAAQGYPLLVPQFRYSFSSGSRPIPVSVTWRVFDSTGIPALDPLLFFARPTASGPGAAAEYEYHYTPGLSYAFFSLTWLDDSGPHGPISSPRFYWSC
jgi:tRNA A-37 threonylcarbamoyl transferase component Bud32